MIHDLTHILWPLQSASFLFSRLQQQLLLSIVIIVVFISIVINKHVLCQFSLKNDLLEFTKQRNNVQKNTISLYEKHSCMITEAWILSFQNPKQL